MFDFNLDPYLSFDRELEKAIAAGVKDANAMSVATVSPAGAPTLRTVLYKGRTEEGISFYTNYEGRKSQQLKDNKRIAALFFWAQLEQQICFEGEVLRLSREENEAYFKTRPRLSQIGAWASQQSQVIPNKEHLENRVREYEKQFEGQEIPCPPNWGGWLIRPTQIEFWFGQGGRLHDRYVFHREYIGASWQRALKSP